MMRSAQNGDFENSGEIWIEKSREIRKKSKKAEKMTKNDEKTRFFTRRLANAHFPRPAFFKNPVPWQSEKKEKTAPKSDRKIHLLKRPRQ